MEIYTIGFTKITAEEFFNRLRSAGIKRLIDVRLNNVSQLAAFTKQDDLKYFLRELCGAEYIHMPVLAPTKEILDAYKKSKKNEGWEEYVNSFNELLAERKVEDRVDKNLFETLTVLLCSEPTAEQCHRRLVAEYLKDKWRDVEIIHL